ncbi:MAG: calcium/sodium antiporter [Candidatus Thermoplasmatota archaeon]|nr:calcium/sodium antiporter [Candidatus Thermoplasmatota archaeon]MBU1940703.1 calcium/sodium antiporter [Candidatus Thermoplasmatota archaeon]
MLPLVYAIPASILGLIFLYKASDILIIGTSKTAARLGISALIISLIIVAFGTSAPEFAISVGAAFQTHTDISIGNIIGSCIANLLLILGVSAIIRPISIHKSVIKRELPILILTTGIFLIFSASNLLDTYHIIGGSLFIIFFIIFLLYFYHVAQKERKHTIKIDNGSQHKNTIFIILGITGVVLGAWLLIEGSVSIANAMGIPQIVIALSMVAIGTSLPELVVSAMAAYRNEADIAVGNIIGSNIFNILLILGVAAVIIPLNTLGSIIHIIFLMLATLFMVPILYTGYTITRAEGFLLLLLYSGYMIILFSPPLL